MRNNLFAAYALDNWRIRGLTLNLGLRWELFTPRAAADGNAVNYDLNTGNLISPNSNNEGPAPRSTSNTTASPTSSLASELPGSRISRRIRSSVPPGASPISSRATV